MAGWLHFKLDLGWVLFFTLVAVSVTYIRMDSLAEVREAQHDTHQSAWMQADGLRLDKLESTLEGIQADLALIQTQQGYLAAGLQSALERQRKMYERVENGREL